LRGPLLELQQRPKQSHRFSLLKSRERTYMRLPPSLAQELAEQELALTLVAEGAEAWVESEEEALEDDDRTQSAEEEDASAASASAAFVAAPAAASEENASASAPSDANAAFVAAFTAALEENARAGASASAGAGAGASDSAVASASAGAGAGASDSAVASAIASAFASAGAGAYYDTSAALAAASIPTSALSARRREKVEDLQEALLVFQVAERARQKVDKEAADAHGAHCRILVTIRRSAKWMASLQARSLRLEMLPGQCPARAGACRRVQARVKVHIDQAKEQAQKLLVLEASAKAEAFFFLHAKKERAGEEARLAAEVGRLQHMVEGQAEYDREAWLLEELQLQAARDDVLRLQEEQEAPRKRKGKKKKTPSRSLRDVQRAALRRAEAEKLVARLESERAERAGEEHERTDWRAVAQDDLVDSDGEPCFEDPRRAEWTDLPQDPREAPEDKAVLALRSLVRAAAEPTAEATARVLARELAAATTSGAGLAKSQSKVFDPGGGV
jgi:hypothetical protein